MAIVKYAIINSDGSIAQTGACPEGNLSLHKLQTGQTIQVLTGAQANVTSGSSVYDHTTDTFAPKYTDLQIAQTTQTNIVQANCAAAITGGFSSSALGQAYTYPSKDTDQANLSQAAIAGGSLWCVDGSGTWALLAHTAEQAAGVLTDFIAARNANQTTLSGLLDQIAAATTVADVQAVTWPPADNASPAQGMGKVGSVGKTSSASTGTAAGGVPPTVGA